MRPEAGKPATFYTPEFLNELFVHERLPLLARPCISESDPMLKHFEHLFGSQMQDFILKQLRVKNDDSLSLYQLRYWHKPENDELDFVLESKGGIAHVRNYWAKHNWRLLKDEDPTCYGLQLNFWHPERSSVAFLSWGGNECWVRDEHTVEMTRQLFVAIPAQPEEKVLEYGKLVPAKEVENPHHVFRFVFHANGGFPTIDRLLYLRNTSVERPIFPSREQDKTITEYLSSFTVSYHSETNTINLTARQSDIIKTPFQLVKIPAVIKFNSKFYQEPEIDTIIELQ